VRACALALLLLLGACATPATDRAPTFANPVLDSNFPDPSVLKAPDGYWYAYATQGLVGGRMANIQLARSPDLVTWEQLGDALPVKPAWASGTQDFWAPDVSLRDGRYLLYYSGRPDARAGEAERGLCLAVATADRPEGPFTDKGAPLLCGQGFEAIDPFAFDDPETGRRLLYWGSGFGSIKAQELTADRLAFAPGSTAVDLVHPIPDEDPANYQRLVEAAAVVRRGGYYYLFYSGDNCCGPKAHYAVMVARSRSATGPFETRAQATGAPDSVILRLGGRWLAPGHNSLVEDASGGWWIVYHAVDTARSREKPGDEPNSRRVMLIDRLVWRNGWPEVAGAAPSQGRQPAPARD
jgi:arabinan endo-1,5-alpha-L-arabinosidase